MSTLYQKVRRYTFPCTYWCICIYVYILHAHANWFKLEPLLAWTQMQTTDDALQIWQLTRRLQGDTEQLEKRRYRHKTPSQESTAAPPLPHCLQLPPPPAAPGIQTPAGKHQSAKDDPSPVRPGPGCGCPQHRRQRRLGLGTRDETPAWKHTLLPFDTGTGITCTGRGSRLSLLNWNKILCYVKVSECCAFA